MTLAGFSARVRGNVPDSILERLCAGDYLIAYGDEVEGEPAYVGAGHVRLSEIGADVLRSSELSPADNAIDRVVAYAWYWGSAGPAGGWAARGRRPDRLRAAAARWLR